MHGERKACNLHGPAWMTSLLALIFRHGVTDWEGIRRKVTCLWATSMEIQTSNLQQGQGQRVWARFLLSFSCRQWKTDFWRQNPPADANLLGVSWGNGSRAVWMLDCNIRNHAAGDHLPYIGIFCGEWALTVLHEYCSVIFPYKWSHWEQSRMRNWCENM